MFNFFAHPAVTSTETVVHDSYLKSTESRLLQVEKEYRAAERAYNDACFKLAQYLAQHKDRRGPFLVNDRMYLPVNLMEINRDPQRAELQAAVRETLQRRNALLEQRKDLLIALRKIR